MSPHPYKKITKKRVSAMNLRMPDETVNLLHTGLSTKYSRKRGFHIWK